MSEAGAESRTLTIEVLLVTVATAVAGAVMLTTLGERPLGIDEGISAERALSGFDRAALSVLYEPNLTFHYVMLWAWARLGDSAFWLRLPSVFFALASVPLCFSVARTLYGRRAAMFAALILTLSPALLAHSRIARPYTLLLFMTLLSTWLYVRASRVSSRVAWQQWGLAAAVSTFVHPTAVLVTGSHVVAWIMDRKRLRWSEFRYGAALVGLSVALLAIVMAVTYDNRLSWVPPLSTRRILSASSELLGLSSDLALAGCVIGVIAGIVMNRSNRAPTLFVSLWLFVTLAATLLISTLQPLIVARYLFPLLPPIVLLLGAFLGRLRPLYGALGLLIFAVAVAPAFATNIVYRDTTHADAMGTITVLAEPRDVVIAQPLLRASLAYQLARSEATEDLPVYAPTDDRATQQFIVSNSDRVWKYHWTISPETHFDLPEGAEETYRQHFGRWVVTLYTASTHAGR